MRELVTGYLLMLLSVGVLNAQGRPAQKFFEVGDSLRRAYRFEEAIEAYQQATEDTLFRNKAQFNMILCENGRNMLQYAVNLKALGAAKIPKESFYLYLAPDSKSYWALPPPGLFPEISAEYPAFVSPANKTILFTGKAKGSGHLDIYISRQLEETLWSYPEVMESSINSVGNECYPVLSADGQTLWFASDGHYGMGGFDLYESHFNEVLGTWKQAQNMGFPFSSPGHDLGFMPTPDGLDAFIVSDRDGDEWHFTIYKVAYELNPERHDWRERRDIALLAQLVPDLQKETSGQAGDATVPQSGAGDYMMLVQNAKKMRDEITALEKKLAQSRDRYATVEEGEKPRLAKRIEEDEMSLLEMREKYRLAGMAVQKAEADFLDKGILPPIEPTVVPKTEPVYSAPFVPQRGTLQRIDSLRFAPPIFKEKPVDISFRIENVSQVIFRATVPDYLFYQIQLSVSSLPEKAAAFKGISPVFESKTSTGKYLYAAGQFSNYDEAATALGQVLRTGIKSAAIIAFHQGKSVTTVVARRLEHSATTVTYRLSLGNYPHGLPQTLLKAIKELTSKDVAKIGGEKDTKYVVGPFVTLQEVQALQRTLTELGFEGMMIETTNP